MGWRPGAEAMTDSNSSGGQQQQAAVAGGGGGNTAAGPAATRQQWRGWSMAKEGKRWWGTTYSEGVVIGGVLSWNICLASGEPCSSRNTKKQRSVLASQHWALTALASQRWAINAPADTIYDTSVTLFGSEREMQHCETSGARHDLFGSVLRGRPTASQAACGW
jgi:hypothetical protein